MNKSLLTGVLLILLSATHAWATGTASVTSGQTYFFFSDEAGAALSNLGVEAKAIKPASYNSGKMRYKFRIPGGSMDEESLRGELLHLGGIELEGFDSRLLLLNLVVDTTGEEPLVTAMVSRNGELEGRIKLFILDTSELQQSRQGSRKINLKNVPLSLHPDAALLLSGVGVTIPEEVGTATVKMIMAKGYSDEEEDDEDSSRGNSDKKDKKEKKDKGSGSSDDDDEEEDDDDEEEDDEDEDDEDDEQDDEDNSPGTLG
jgi:hypothetical protein